MFSTRNTKLIFWGALLRGTPSGALSTASIPAQAQVIDQRSFAVLDKVAPPNVTDGITLFFPPGLDDKALKAKPFHIYDEEFLTIIGPNPTLTIIASGPDDPFHEAPIWIRATDEMFFAQNSGSKDAGTGIAKSAIIQKISLTEAAAYSSARNATGKVKVTVTTSNPTVLNPNGGTNYKGQLLFVGDGQGDHGAPAIYIMNPLPPYNTTTILNNYFGRQFNSIDDVAIHPINKDIYFTDPTYGYVQEFRPPPGLQKQVWRFNDRTGAVTVVADSLNMPNGIGFSPDGAVAYITDTGIAQGVFGINYTFPSSIYRYDVGADGTFGNRKVFAFVSPGVPDGVRTDTRGNVYAACGDGVHVFNPSGKLLGKIYIGTTSANFQFARGGRMVVLGEKQLYYVTLAAEGAFVNDYL